MCDVYNICAFVKFMGSLETEMTKMNFALRFQTRKSSTEHRRIILNITWSVLNSFDLFLYWLSLIHI